MASRVPRARSTQSVGEVRGRLAGADRYDSAVDVAVLDGDCLVGLVRIEDLLAASADAPMAAIMDRNPSVVATGVDQEQGARQAAAREESSFGVVETNGRFLGLIPPHRMLRVLLEEHREDLARISGYLHQNASARTASEEGVVRRLWHRFPFLLVRLVAPLAAAPPIEQTGSAE
jgi:magnesium transporter